MKCPKCRQNVASADYFITIGLLKKDNTRPDLTDPAYGASADGVTVCWDCAKALAMLLINTLQGEELKYAYRKA